MFSEVSLKNIRVFGAGGSNFNLRILSIFCGTNSSGKSTILKSFLLLRQSQGIYELYGKRPGTLRFTGSQVDLGNYTAIVTDNILNKNIEISITVEDKIANQIILELAKNKGVNLNLKGTRNQTNYHLKSTFSFKSSRTVTETEEAGNIRTVAPQGILNEAKFSIIVQDFQIATWSVKVAPSQKGDGLSYRLQLSPNEIPENDLFFLEFLKQSPNTGGTISVDVILDGLLPYSAVPTDRKSRERRIMLPYHIRASMIHFNRALGRIHYLAPLRSNSRRYYVANYDITPDLDPRGDFLPYVLGGIIEEPEIDNVLPRGKTIIRQNLSQALNGWLSYLKTGTGLNKTSLKSEYDVSTIKGAVVEIGLKPMRGNIKHSIADSGFGYSQVLPILVRGLIAPVNSTLIVEQPELHLNPALQVRLADFFISMVRAGKQVILETHSEHIVNTIRARTAEDKDRFLSSNSMIYFLDITSRGLKVHEMNIREDGTLPKWPSNFFGEAALITGQLLRAQSRFLKR